MSGVKLVIAAPAGLGVAVDPPGRSVTVQRRLTTVPSSIAVGVVPIASIGLVVTVAGPVAVSGVGVPMTVTSQLAVSPSTSVRGDPQLVFAGAVGGQLGPVASGGVGDALLPLGWLSTSQRREPMPTSSEGVARSESG